jgi:hypothetical protein
MGTLSCWTRTVEGIGDRALAASKEGVVMDFLDPNGKQRVVLTHTGLRLFDANERSICDAP